MNILAYESDTAWNKGFPCTFLWTLIQLYLYINCLYSLTYCINEVIKNKIFWRLNEKVPSSEVDTTWDRVIPWIFSKHWSNCILFIYFSIFDILYQRGYRKKYLWTLNLKSNGLLGSFDLKQGNPLKTWNC